MISVSQSLGTHERVSHRSVCEETDGRRGVKQRRRASMLHRSADGGGAAPPNGGALLLLRPAASPGESILHAHLPAAQQLHQDVASVAAEEQLGDEVKVGHQRRLQRQTTTAGRGAHISRSKSAGCKGVSWLLAVNSTAPVGQGAGYPGNDPGPPPPPPHQPTHTHKQPCPGAPLPAG